jgi:hypothetical protein
MSHSYSVTVIVGFLAPGRSTWQKGGSAFARTQNQLVLNTTSIVFIFD